jgi:membrane-bound inhibitor of C-type lysozyme
MSFGGMSGGVGPSSGYGGSGGSVVSVVPTDPNVLVAIVDSGPKNIGYTNGLFASVTFCVPGTTTCQTIDHLLVDTGSVGVRVLESELTLALPEANSTSGLGLAECTPFVDGTAWGPVKFAEVTLGSETAANLPIQLIGENTYTMPSDCTGTAITDFESLAANGILGVGVYVQDCGTACAQPATSRLNPGLYYACSAASCSIASVPLAQQVAHPVAAFPVDNNGTIIQLPSISASGAASASGILVFGIGTQTNNGLGSATVLALDGQGFVSTTFPMGGKKYTSYLDSGSNGLFFLNAATTNLKQCTGGLKDFYCPASTTNLSATLSSTNGASADIQFSVANTSKLSSQVYAISNLAGPMPGFPLDTSVPGFDWGLPFYYGIEQQNTPGGIGPYFAF